MVRPALVCLMNKCNRPIFVWDRPSLIWASTSRVTRWQPFLWRERVLNGLHRGLQLSLGIVIAAWKTHNVFCQGMISDYILRFAIKSLIVVICPWREGIFDKMIFLPFEKLTCRCERWCDDIIIPSLSWDSSLKLSCHIPRQPALGLVPCLPTTSSHTLPSPYTLPPLDHFERSWSLIYTSKCILFLDRPVIERTKLVFLDRWNHSPNCDTLYIYFPLQSRRSL
jgi:hypothetical protein